MGARRAVVAVLLPREHLPFLRHWCEHHVAQGFEIVLYDNTGSTGSRRRSCSYHPDRRPPAGHDGRGLDYASYTAALSDEAVQAVLRQVVRDLPVRIVRWAPTDEHGAIVFDQVEAYVDYIERSRSDIEWAAFIDGDEYLQCAPGCTWDDLLDAAEERRCSRLVLEGVEFESRWTVTGRPRSLPELACLGAQSYGYKNMVRLAAVERADIHYAWTMSDGDRQGRVDPRQHWFDHYRGGPDGPRPRIELSAEPLRTATDESVPVRAHDAFGAEPTGGAVPILERRPGGVG